MWSVFPKDPFRLYVERPLHSEEQQSLLFLYQPLAGAEAINLYLLMHALAEREPDAQWRHRLLLSLTGWTMDVWLQARHRLEGLGLLRSYAEEGETRCMHYRLQLPLSPRQFFASDVLAVMLLNRLGEPQYQQLQQMLCRRFPDVPASLKEVSRAFHDVYSPLSPNDLRQAETLTTPPPDDTEPEVPLGDWSFDVTYMRSRVGAVFGLDKHWNRQTETRLLQLARLYRLTEDELARLIQEHLFARDAFDWEQFRREVVRWAQSRAAVAAESQVQDQPPQEQELAGLTDAQRHMQDLETISPYALLYAYSDGAKVADSDLRLVHSLLEEYKLKPGVVNVLIEYVMFTNNYKLPKALVEKIASHWKRLRIETVADAQALCRKEHQMYRNWPSKGSERKRTAPAAGTEPRTHRRVQPLPQSVREQLMAPDTTPPLSDEQRRLQQEKEARALELLKALGELK